MKIYKKYIIHFAYSDPLINQQLMFLQLFAGLWSFIIVLTISTFPPRTPYELGFNVNN